VIASVIYGDLSFRVFLYLEWDAFAALAKEEGSEFAWSSEKYARQVRAMKPEIRPVVARGRVPQIKVEDAVYGVTDPMRVQTFFDGFTPRTLVRNTIELARIQLEQYRAGQVGIPAKE